MNNAPPPPPRPRLPALPTINDACTALAIACTPSARLDACGQLVRAAMLEADRLRELIASSQGSAS